MTWLAGKRRHDTDAARFVDALCREFSARELGRLCGVSDRTVRRWRDGTDWPTADVLTRLVDRLFPQSEGSGPIYSPEMAIDANTRVGGVGEHTIRAARGEIIFDET
jgi:hypothetical protein